MADWDKYSHSDMPPSLLPPPQVPELVLSIKLRTLNERLGFGAGVARLVHRLKAAV